MIFELGLTSIISGKEIPTLCFCKERQKIYQRKYRRNLEHSLKAIKNYWFNFFLLVVIWVKGNWVKETLRNIREWIAEKELLL